MKSIKLVFVVLLVSVFCIGLRAGVKRFAPSLYARVWGVTSVHEGEGKAAALVVAEQPAPPISQPEPKESAEPEVFATGAVRRGKRVVVQMSDGSVRTELDNTDGEIRLSRVTRTFADFDGKRYWFKPTRIVGAGAEAAPESTGGRAPGRDIPQESARLSSGGEASPGPAEGKTESNAAPSTAGLGIGAL